MSQIVLNQEKYNVRARFWIDAHYYKKQYIRLF